MTQENRYMPLIHGCSQPEKGLFQHCLRWQPLLSAYYSLLHSARAQCNIKRERKTIYFKRNKMMSSTRQVKVSTSLHPTATAQARGSASCCTGFGLCGKVRCASRQPSQPLVEPLTRKKRLKDSYLYSFLSLSAGHLVGKRKISSHVARQNGQFPNYYAFPQNRWQEQFTVNVFKTYTIIVNVVLGPPGFECRQYEYLDLPSNSYIGFIPKQPASFCSTITCA